MPACFGKFPFGVIMIDMSKLVAFSVAGVVLALVAPIWRGAGHSRKDGVSFPQLAYDSTRTLAESPFGHPHIPYDEAVSRAREAYESLTH
jgi:hypothetical protein